MNASLPNTVGLIVKGLKSRNEDERFRTVQELYRIVDRELKEVSLQNYVFFLDMICNEIINIYTSGELWEKKGAILAMGCLTEVDFMSVHSYCRRFAKLLLNRTSTMDIQLAALEARILGEFSVVFPYDFVEEQAKLACDTLPKDAPDSQRQFSILVLRELVLNAPTSFYQQFGAFVCAIMSVFRDKNIVTRELASITLRSAFELAAAREQRNRMGVLVGSGGGVFAGADAIRGLDLQGSTAVDSIDTYGFNRPNTVARHSLSQDTQVNGLARGMAAHSSSPIDWYRNCLIEALRAFPGPGTSSSGDPNTAAKKLHRDDWTHGSMLLLMELLIAVQPAYEELLNELDEMVGVPLADFLSTTTNEGTQAVRTVLSSRWSTLTNPSLLIASGLLPAGSPFSFSPTDSMLDAVGLPCRTLTCNALSAHQAPKKHYHGPTSALCHRLLMENVDKLWVTVSSWMANRNPQLVVFLIRLIPRLVALDPSAFLTADRHKPTMEWLFQCLRRDREKPTVLLSLALIGYHMRLEFINKGYTAQLLPLIQSYLPVQKEGRNKKRSVPLETSAILSIGLLVKSLGPALHEPVKQMLDAMVASGLNQPLISTCKLITEHIPQLRKEIQDRILNDISLILMHNSGSSFGQTQTSQSGTSMPPVLSFIPNLPNALTNLIGPLVGATATSANSAVVTSGSNGTLTGSGNIPLVGSGPTSSATSVVSRVIFHTHGKPHLSKSTSCGISCTAAPGSELGNVSLRLGTISSSEVSPEVAVVALALRTLGSFNFEGHPLAHFVRHISENFISVTTCEVKEVRLEAVKTCARLMVPWLKSVDSQHWYARPAVNTVADILSKLLIVGTSDPDPDVRRCVFDSIDRGFDPHLAQADHLLSLFLALQDEVFDIRVSVLQRLGRLSDINPACVQPNLRKVLLHILDNLAHSGSTRNKEQSALLLACLVASAPNFFTPYAEPVIQILIPRIRQALPVSLRASLAASAVSRLQESSSIFNAERCESVCASILDDQRNSTAQAMHAAVLATQLSANAAVATANAVAAAAAAAATATMTDVPGLGINASVMAQQQASRLALSKRGTHNTQTSSTANAVAMATNAAATAATAAAVVLNATGQYADGSVRTIDCLSNQFARCGGLPAEFTAFAGTYVNDIINLGTRPKGLNMDFGCDRSLEPPGGPGGLSLALQTALNRMPTSSSQPGLGLTATDATGLPISSPASTQWTEPTSVIIALFTALGRLSAVAPCSIRSYMDEFIPVLCWMMQDSSCLFRRSIAVWTLSRLISNAGFVCSPYRRHPQLLQTLLDMLKREESKEIRQEVLRALGVLGALDPFKVKLYSGQVNTFGDTGIAVSLHEADEKKDVDITQSELVVSLSRESKDVFFSVCALSALIQTLRDPALRSQYGNIVRVIVYVLRLLGSRSVYYLRQLMPDYFNCLRETHDVRLQEFLIRKLGSIMSVVRLHTKEFAHEVVDLLIAHWWLAPSVQNACITVLSSMVSALGAEFRPFLTRLIPVILRTLHHESNETNLIALLEVLPEFGYTLEDHAHILVPAIAKLIDVTSEANLSILLNTALESSPATQSQSPPVNSEATAASQNLEESDAALLPDFIDGTLDLINTSHAALADNGTVCNALSDGPTSSPVLSTTPTSFGSDGVIGSVQLRRSCLECLARFTDRIDLDDLAGQIVHPICRLLLKLEACHQQFQYLTQHHHHVSTGSSSSSSGVKSAALAGTEACAKAINALHPAAVDVLTGLLLRMGQKFRLLLPVVQKTLNSLRLRTPRFYMVLGRVEKGAYLPTTNDQVLADITSIATQSRSQHAQVKEPDPVASLKLLRTNGMSLERAWGSSRIVSRDDWDQWLKTLTTALLRESPSPAIRACSQLTAIAPVIGRILFNAAFVSCWPELTAPQQDSLISTLELVLRVPDQSPDVSQTILNLEEFMAHVDKYAASSHRVPLPLSLNVLADRAMKNRAYAKALYYKEQEFLEELEKRSSPSPATLSCLLTIYSKLQLEEAAAGVLLYATRNPHDKLVNEEVWREKLHDWKYALNLYERKLEDDRIKNKNSLILGRMRCLRALGQWAPLNTMAWERWEQVDETMRAKMAPLACSAAWATNSWDQVEHYVSALPADDSFDGAFYRAVLNIHSGSYASACDHIVKARNVLDADLTTMAGESYDRAYADLVGTQLLSEAEEVIQYKLVPERRPVLREVWRSRLRGCQAVVEDWGQIIQLRSLVLEPQEDLKTWLRFVGLCRRNGRFSLARQLLENLLGQDPATISPNEPIPSCDPSVVFSYTKLLWATGAHEEAVTRLYVLKSNVLEPMLQMDSATLGVTRQAVPGGQLWPPAAAVGSSEVLDAWDPRSVTAQTTLRLQELRCLMAKCCLRLGSWYSELYTRTPPGCGSGGSDIFYPATSILPSTTGSRRPSRSTGATASTYDSVPNTGSQLRSSSSRLPASSSQTRRVQSGSGSASRTDPAGVNVTQAWENSQAFVIDCYRSATIHAPDNRAAWQSWAMANYAVFNHLDTIKARIERAEMELNKVGPTSPSSLGSGASGTGGNTLPQPAQPIAELVRAKTNLQRCMELHAAPSVRGFVNSISLSPSANMQDSLRLINLLFKFGHLAEIREVIREGLTKISLENWLLVIQQLLARIDTPREYVASIIIDLLISVGHRYPQSMVYPLVLAFKSGGSDRRRYNANRILYSMEEHSPRLVAEAFLLNEELIRLSITWVELWFESLEDASRVFFGEKDFAKMFRLLHPLHQMMDRGHETIHEATFLQEHGSELTKCRVCCETFEHKRDRAILQQAWDGYYNLYRRFSKQVNNMTTLELSVASPRLHEYGQDWQLAVPGSYEPHRPLVRIAGIKNCLTFMTSKQHPRKLTVLGSNGHQYMFLLKGHEDTRQDERVMQFFGLVNTLLMNNPETLRRNLTIQRMSIIPLSTNTGLIGWVPNSDTLHSLIRDYREKTGTMLNKENKQMLHLAPDFDRLNVIQKTEIFEAGLRESSGRDLANILWLKSHSSEAWFERRTNFVRSMATMSMVGYILGLGDRHPSNIMLSRETGKVVHIDFGDCFEVAMMREKFPEKVPFRLTRMIIAAMEVTGIDGVYRQTCEMVLSLVRTHRESLLAVLEAFIYDPLLQWVLLENRKDFTHLDNRVDEVTGGTGAAAAAATTTNTAAPGPVQNGVAPMMNGVPGVPGAQQVKAPAKPGDLHHRQPQNLGTQTTTARRPADRTGGLAPANAATQMQPNAYEHQMYGQTHSSHSSRRVHNSPRRVFTNPNHPDSLSLRDPHKINPWRHHLCNGPWFGCYETAKTLRKQTESGHIVVERQGLQGFIFSAKPPSEEEASSESEAYPVTLGNTRARAVMEKIRQKLTGTERDVPMDVPTQVDYLIREAASNQNLCQMYIGWCAFW